MHSSARLAWLTSLLAAALLAGMLVSPRLWLADRFYPLTPVWDGLLRVPAPWDGWWFVLLLVLLVGTALLRRSRFLLWSCVGLAVGLALLDQSRWQPWFYQYLAMLVAVGLGSWGRRPAVEGGKIPAQERQATAGNDPAQESQATRDAALNACRVIVAGIYFWSGLQKANHGFLDGTFAWLIDPFFAGGQMEVPAWAVNCAWLVPPTEAAIGLGLLSRWTRPVALAGACGMHLFILGSIGPWGWNWNTVVWPWNIALPLAGGLLFVGTRDVGAKEILVPRRWFHAAAIVLFGLLPALSFFNWWDLYLSAALYSGDTPRASVELSETAYTRLPPTARQASVPIGGGRWQLDYLTWSLAELNVPPYPALRVQRHIAQELCNRVGQGPGDVTLVIEERPDRWTGEREETRLELLPEPGMRP